MIRAVLFDFYGVWTPDKLADCLKAAAAIGPQVEFYAKDNVDKYYRGDIDVEVLAANMSQLLSRPDITVDDFILTEESISPKVAEFFKGLLVHFVKLGILANLGTQELELLNSFNSHNQVFDCIGGPLALKIDAPLLSEDVFAGTLNQIGEPPNNCLAVSSMPEYLKYAHEVGMGTLVFEGFAQLETDLNNILNQELPTQTKE